MSKSSFLFNAAMIAGLAWYDFKARHFDGSDLDAYSRMPELTKVAFVGK